MDNNKKSPNLISIIFIGIIIILATIGVITYCLKENTVEINNNVIENSTENIENELNIDNTTIDNTEEAIQNDIPEDINENVIDENVIDESTSTTETTDQTQTESDEPVISQTEEIEPSIEPEVKYVQGMEVSGTIKIPKYNVDSPIFKNATLKSLQISVAVAYGNLNEVGNTTIFGHAYTAYPFENVSKLENGDTITIIDNFNREIAYEVYDKQVINAQDATYMIRNTNGAREISLQTGNSDTTRLIVLAREVNK